MCTAAASWRTCSKPSLEPSTASKIGMMWLPDRVKTCEQPASSRARTTRSAPRIELAITGASGKLTTPVRLIAHLKGVE